MKKFKVTASTGDIVYGGSDGIRYSDTAKKYGMSSNDALKLTMLSHYALNEYDGNDLDEFFDYFVDRTVNNPKSGYYNDDGYIDKIINIASNSFSSFDELVRFLKDAKNEDRRDLRKKVSYRPY